MLRTLRTPSLKSSLSIYISRESASSQKVLEGLDTQGRTLSVSVEGGKAKVISVISELFSPAHCQSLKSKELILLSLVSVIFFILSPSGMASIGPLGVLVKESTVTL